MVSGILHVLTLAATLSCQQTDRREAAGEVSATLPTRAPIATNDVAVRAAQIELADGHAWAATRAIMPVLRSPERRTPEALLVAARAAADWGGWTHVNALLAFEPWIDTRFGGEARELLALSAVERGRSSEARPHAEAALRLAEDPGTRIARQVLLARILDRLEIRDSAAILYKDAADDLPLARDWLLLRAAGVTRDRDRRDRLYRGVWSVAAKARVPYTEAQALERFKMVLAAADAYEKLGDQTSAFRLRLSATSDPAQRRVMRAGLLRVILSGDRDDVARAIEVLDGAFPQLDASAQATVARRAGAVGLSARAALGFSRLPAAALKDDDVIAWARALVATGRAREATRRIAARRFAKPNAAEAAYVRAHALLRAGSPTAAVTALRRVASTYPTSSAAADALFLLADLETDAGRETNARTLLNRACAHRPSGNYSDEACFRAAILTFALGQHAAAAKAFDDYATRFPRSPDATAAKYWAGRSWQRAGNDSIARARWGELASGQRLSYYGAASARRLGQASWIPAAPELKPTQAYTGGLARAAVLEQLGLDVEKRYEYESIERDASQSIATALSVGATLLARGETPRAIRLGWRTVEMARDSGITDERGYALVYPLLLRETLLEHARANRLDPAVVAGVIRQESAWNPRAVSSAGARGLMQVMPSVGRQIAQSRGYPAWDAALLFEPQVSLELGTVHLRGELSTYRNNLPRALAAYNAGGSRVRRWMRRVGTDDPELFIERIPFVETRDYVRIVLRNIELYRALHGLKTSERTSDD